MKKSHLLSALAAVGVMLGGGIPSDAHAAVPLDCRPLDFGIPGTA